MRQLVAFSKRIAMSNRERAKFEASLAGKKLEFPTELSEPGVDPEVKAKIKEIAEKTARSRGWIK